MRNRKTERIDEYAETQVLHDAKEHASDRDADALSLYFEYERELTRESARPARKRR